MFGHRSRHCHWHCRDLFACHRHYHCLCVCLFVCLVCVCLRHYHCLCVCLLFRSFITSWKQSQPATFATKAMTMMFVWLSGVRCYTCCLFLTASGLRHCLVFLLCHCHRDCHRLLSIVMDCHSFAFACHFYRQRRRLLLVVIGCYIYVYTSAYKQQAVFLLMCVVWKTNGKTTTNNNNNTFILQTPVCNWYTW